MKSRAGKRQREEEDYKKEDANARKGRKVAKHCVFPMIRGSGGSKSRLAKAAGAELAGQMREEKIARRCGAKHISKSKCTKHTIVGPLLEIVMSKKCTPLWREARFEVKMYKTPQLRATFGSWNVEKLHAVVARSTFPSQNAQKTPCSDHFWSFRCRKKTHFEVKMYKTHHARTTFGASDVEKVHAVVARSTFPSQNVQNTTCSRHFWRFRCRFASRHYTTGHNTTLRSSTLHYTTLHYTTLHYTTLHYTTLQLQLHNYTPLHSTTLNYTTLHYITLHYTPLHYSTLHCTTFHYTSLHYTTLHYTTTTTTTTTTQLHSTTIHSTTLHYTKLHYTTLHYTTLHSTTLHYITLHYNTLHYTPLH